ncbi:MAG: phytoene dehydrogenase [Actinomycetota bacterium]
MRVIVIGAGFGGLSAAAHLVGAGHEVTVVEREDRPGGRAGVVRADGFALETGPTVLTMPNLVEATFAAAGRDMSQYVTLTPVDPMYRAVFADGSELTVRAGRDAMREEIRTFASAREAGAFGEFCDWVTDLFNVEMPNFIDRNYDSVLDVVRPWRAMYDLVRLGGFGRLDGKVASFFADERLRRVFSFQSLYAGVSPHEALALYSVITYMDMVGGVYAARGGMSAIATGLARAVRDAGATMRFGTSVSRVLRRGDGGVVGVELATGERFTADAVVCNADLPVAYRTLLGDLEAPRIVRRGRSSPSCVLWVAGVRGGHPDGVARHNVHFGDEWEESFASLIRRGTRMRDPSFMVGCASVDDPTLAPEGCSTVYALEPVPNLDGRIDWSRHGERIRAELRNRVASLGYATDDVVVERWFDPLDWEAAGLQRGTPFALAHTFRQTGPFRPANLDRRVPGLFFVGASTLPGVGVPMVLVSGRLTAERVEAYAKETAVLRW